MINSLKIKNSTGAELELVGNSAYDVINIDGLNPSSVSISSSKTANGDGLIINGVKVNERNIVFKINIKPPIEENRVALYPFFRAKKDVEIKIRTDTRDVHIYGKVESFENNHFGMTQQPQISIVCPNPYFLEKEESLTRFSNIESLFEFPFAIEEEGIPLSEILVTDRKTINVGEVETGVIFELYALADGVKNPKIYNHTTNEYFGINSTMQAGDLIRINTNKGEKGITLIRSGEESNYLSKRAQGSAWITCTEGENDISFDSESGADDLQMSVSITRKFEGI